MDKKAELFDALEKKAFTPYEHTENNEIVVAYIPNKDEDTLQQIADQMNFYIRFGKAKIHRFESKVAFFRGKSPLH